MILPVSLEGDTRAMSSLVIMFKFEIAKYLIYVILISVVPGIVVY